MPAFCTAQLRPPRLLPACDPIMRLGGVDRQLPVGHVVYHDDTHAMYERHYHQQQAQVRAGTELHDASRNAVKNENENQRNLTTEMLCAGSADVGKTPKYDILNDVHCL